MESGNDGASSKGVLVPVPDTNDEFQSSILAPLKSAYLHEDSNHSFEYNSAFLVKNPALEKKYNDFRAKKRAAGYSEEDLKESFGFLLFDDVNQANTLGESGVLTGNSTCTTLGDPSDGIYISMYSDCLDHNRWYGKSGYIAIIRLTKGRVKKVSESYTQDFTAPTAGFDCHVSDQLPSVSEGTSAFLAFERTQYYMYELLDDGSNKTAQSPSAACPYAIVSFSYTDTKATQVAPQEDRQEKKQSRHYIWWRGQLQICDQFYDVRLRSTPGALISAQLPPVVKTDWAVSMSNLRHRLPKAVFETCFSGEVFQDSLWCSVCEFVSSEVEEADSLSALLSEVEKKDVAFAVRLNDGGFLFLVHSSHFLTYDDTGSSVTEVLRGVFVYPDSRVVQKDTKLGHRKPHESSEILRVLPVLSYAEEEVEKAPLNPSEDLSEVVTQHMQSYAALLNPELDIVPSREVSIFADQYDVPDAHKYLYASPEWTERAWQSLKMYLSKPASFQLPLAKASEILMAKREDRVEDFEDDVYICPSPPPEEEPDDSAAIFPEDQLAGQTSVNFETSVDGVEAPLDSRTISQNVVPEDLRAEGSSKDSEKSEQSEGIKTDVIRTNNLIPSMSDELPAEMIVTERAHEHVICSQSATKQYDMQILDLSTAKSHTAGVNPLNDETVESKQILDSHGVNNLTKTKRRKARRGRFKHPKKVSHACDETNILPTPDTNLTPVANDNLESQEDKLAKEPEDDKQLSNPPIVDWRKVRKRKRIFGKLSPRSKKMKHFTVGPASSEEEKKGPEQQRLESTFIMELGAFPLRRKTERWDLKPVVSMCGRILIPHGSVLVADKIKSLQDQLQSARNGKCQEKTLGANDTVEMDQKLNSAQETSVDKIESTSFKDGENSLSNASVAHVSPEHSIFKLLDVGCDSSEVNTESGSGKNDVTNMSPSQAVQEKPSDPLISGKSSTKGELLLSKLRSVLSRGRRKMNLLGSEETDEGSGKATELCPKRSNVDSETSIVKRKDTITSVENADLGLKEVSKMLSVDPLFAYALGLTPKAIPKMVQKTDGLSIDQMTGSSQTQVETMLDKEPKIIQKPPPIFPRKGRIKTLKKQQDVSAENVKKKWWLHFQTPASYASDKLNNKESARNNSVRKPVKERLSNACPSTDALTLLADLALSASHDQVPTQPDSALGRQPETSLKKCDLTKDVTSVDQESVLHALLRQPAVRSTQPVESPSPSHLVGGSELVDLVSREHAYSLPPSSSLPLGLPGTPLQVSSLCDSTGLLHHQKTMYDDGTRPQHPSVVQKDGGEQNSGAAAYMKKHMTHRRKFKHSRTFVSKDAAIQVTKQWKENYDFSLDSKFATDPKDKAIVRALHGSWDHSVQDTSEEVRFIVHMWIGLFYSRSTARFFQVDLDSRHAGSEESTTVEKSSVTVSSSDQSELKAKAEAPLPNVVNTSDPSMVKALDLSKKEDPASDQGTVVLDLSLKNSVAEVVTPDLQVAKKETPVPSELKETSNQLNIQSSKRQQEARPFQVCRETKFFSGMIDVRGFFKNMGACTPLQQTTMLPFRNAALIPLQKAHNSVFFVPYQTAGNADKMDLKPVTGNSQTTEISLAQPPGEVTSKSKMDDAKKEVGDVALTVQHDDIEPKDGKKLEVNRKPLQKDDKETSPKAIQTCCDATNKESGNLGENERQLSSEGLMPLSESKAVSVNEDGDRSTFTESVGKDESSAKEDRLGKTDTCVSVVSDVSDQPTSVTCDGPDSAAVNAQSDVSDQPTSVTCDGPDSAALNATSDERDQPSSVLFDGPDSAALNATSDERDQPTSVTCDAPDSAAVNAQSDVSDQPTSVTCDGPDSAALNATSDERDQPTSVTCNGPDSAALNATSDECDQPTSMTCDGPDSAAVNAQSDVSDQPTSVTCDGLDSAAENKSDESDQPTSVTCDGLDSAAENKSDECDQPTSVTCDGPDSAAENKSDESDQPTSVTCDGPDSAAENKSDESDQPTSVTCDGPDSAAVNAQSDECDQPTSVTCDGPDSAAENKSHESDQPTSVTCDGPDSAAENKSHESDQPTSVMCDGPDSAAVNSQSDVSDQPTTVTCDGPDSAALNATSDERNQPTSVTCDGPDSVAVNTQSNVSNQPTSLKFDGLDPATENKSDESDRPTSVTCDGPDSAAVNAQSDVSDQPTSVTCDGPDSAAENKSDESDQPTSVTFDGPDSAASNATSDERDQPSYVSCNGPDSAAFNAQSDESITKLDGQARSDELPAQADKKVEAHPDFQSSGGYADDMVLSAEQAITAKAPQTPPKLEADLYNPVIEEELPQTYDSTEPLSKNKAMTSFSQRNDGHEDCDSKLVIGEQMAADQTQKEPSVHQSDSSQREPTEPETERAETEDLTSGEENKGLGTGHSRIIIPFIGVDISGEDLIQPQDSPLQGNAGSESDDRCPTPTMDEKPYGSSKSSSSQNCKSPLSGGNTLTQKWFSRSSVPGKDEKPVEPKPSQASVVNGYPGTHHGLPPDLEARTLRVLQSIDKFLPRLSPPDKPSLIKTADVKQKPQTLNPNVKCLLNSFAQSYGSKDFKDQKMSNKKSAAAVSAPTPQKLPTEPSGNLLILPFKNKMEKVLGVGLQQQTDTSVHQHYLERKEKSQQTSSELDVCHPHQSLPSTSCLGAMDSNLSYDPRLISQRPVMAGKPAKSDENQAECFSKDRLSENYGVSQFPQNKPTKTFMAPSIAQTTKCMESKKGNSKGLDNSSQEALEGLSKSSWSLDTKSHKAHQDPLYRYQEKDTSKFKISLSSRPVQTFGSAKSLSQLVDGKQSLTNSSAEKLGHPAKESLEINQRNCSEASTLHVGYEDMDESLYLGPDSSLSCTVYNTSRKRSYSFLEQVSQRCIQEDPTEASMENECLIFSEKMKQLMKRCKMGSVHQLDAHSKANPSCPNPMLVQFSGLEEQEESGVYIDNVSLFGKKFKVDMSDRKDLAEKAKTPSPGAGTPIEHAGVSALTAECAELYEAMMNDVCAMRDVPSKPKHIRMDRSNQKAEPSNYFDFCDQMKREMDESFRSRLNSIVKKSCKTKYRFYILETSADAFFEETKAQLEAEGHTAVQPSEFFLKDVTPSSLLIILRNEDIAEHICKVPHLLELKKCPGVQFAGIDEPDDVVNLTHQELFTRGGFIMFDRAALEPLNLCDMKKISEILQELSKTGRWKWMLHYRDSRRIKENAILSAEAKKKKLFLNWCQEAGLLEVLPYHECDLMSRDQPDYLTCLVRLQVQNIMARYTVFITDSVADSAFKTKGIITMTISSFLSSVISSTKHHGLETSRFCFANEEDFAESLQKNNVQLFLTTDRSEASQALQKGHEGAPPFSGGSSGGHNKPSSRDEYLTDDPELWNFTVDGIEELDVAAGGPPSRVLRPSTPGNHQMQTRSKTPQRSLGRPPDEAPSYNTGQNTAQSRPHFQNQYQSRPGEALSPYRAGQHMKKRRLDT